MDSWKDNLFPFRMTVNEAINSRPWAIYALKNSSGGITHMGVLQFTDTGNWSKNKYKLSDKPIPVTTILYSRYPRASNNSASAGHLPANIRENYFTPNGGASAASSGGAGGSAASPSGGASSGDAGAAGVGAIALVLPGDKTHQTLPRLANICAVRDGPRPDEVLAKKDTFNRNLWVYTDDPHHGEIFIPENYTAAGYSFDGQLSFISKDQLHFCYIKSKEDTENLPECPICLDKVGVLQCAPSKELSHPSVHAEVFHYKCLQALQTAPSGTLQKRECPICRRLFTDIERKYEPIVGASAPSGGAGAGPSAAPAAASLSPYGGGGGGGASAASLSPYGGGASAASSGGAGAGSSDSGASAPRTTNLGDYTMPIGPDSTRDGHWYKYNSESGPVLGKIRKTLDRNNGHQDHLMLGDEDIVLDNHAVLFTVPAYPVSAEVLSNYTIPVGAAVAVPGSLYKFRTEGGDDILGRAKVLAVHSIRWLVLQIGPDLRDEIIYDDELYGLNTSTGSSSSTNAAATAGGGGASAASAPAASLAPNGGGGGGASAASAPAASLSPYGGGGGGGGGGAAVASPSAGGGGAAVASPSAGGGGAAVPRVTTGCGDKCSIVGGSRRLMKSKKTRKQKKQNRKQRRTLRH